MNTCWRRQLSPPALVVVVDNPALEFLLDHREQLAPGVPVVFCGINFYRDEILRGQQLIAGVAEEPSFRETLDAALRLDPKIRKAPVLGEDTATFRANRSLLEMVIPHFAGWLEFSFFLDPNISRIEERLAGLWCWSRSSAVVNGSSRPPFSQTEAVAWLQRAVTEGPQLFEWRARHRDSHLFWVEVNMRSTLLWGGAASS